MSDISKELQVINNIVRRRIHESNEFQKVSKITNTNTRIMSYLGRQEGQKIYQKDIEEELGITRSTVSRVLKRMEEKGLIVRQSVEQDSRLKRLILTEEAMEMHQQIIEHIEQVEAQLLKDFDKNEKEMLHTYIQRMKNNMEEN